MELEKMKVDTNGLVEIAEDDDEIINFWEDEQEEKEEQKEKEDSVDIEIDTLGEFDDLDSVDWDNEIDTEIDTLENSEKDGLEVENISKDIGLSDSNEVIENGVEDRSETAPDEAGDSLDIGGMGIDDEVVRIDSDWSEGEIEGSVNSPIESDIGNEEEENIEGDSGSAVIIDNDFIDENGNILLQSKDESTHDRFKLEYIDITKIAVVKRVRLSKGVEDLLESIKSTGLLNPIVVAPTATDGVYVLINGYRRLIACAKLGIKEIPSIVNNKIETKDIPILETMYNRYKPYTMQEIVKCIDYLRNEKGIQSTSMIEYLLQLDSGDCSKLQDIIEDDDADIVDPLLNGEISITQAFKKLEQRRKKESKEEKEIKQASKVYTENSEQALEDIKDAGEEAHEEAGLTDEEIESLAISNEEIAESENESLDGMVEQGKEIKGFEDHKQDYQHREHLDPALRKSVLARDDNTCMCCGLQGQEYIGVFDVHHKVEVYLGGDDSIDNLITVCTVCHRLIHSYGRGELYIRPESELGEEEKIKFKKIVKLGNKIREGMALKGMKKERLKELDNIDKIGRTKPGTPIQQAT